MNAVSAVRLPEGVDLFERGWLSSNNVLLHGASPDEGAVLVDTGYATHAPQTLALVAAALQPEEPLRLILNTHLHSDHCGGNAALIERHGCEVLIPPGGFDAALAWDESRLSFQATGQRCERFPVAGVLAPGEVIQQAGREWEIHAAPGHDPDSVILFEPSSGTLISADALWESGFGIVFPELDGESAFDDVADTLDLIASLRPKLVIPGHGAAFSDLDKALGIARQKLAYFRQQPARHALHGAKALAMFHMLEIQECSEPALVDWLATTPILQRSWAGFFPETPLYTWAQELAERLISSGQLRITSRDGETYVRA